MILITGATGLVGSHLLHKLLSGEERVRAIRRPGSDVAGLTAFFEMLEAGSSQRLSRVEWVDADLLDYDALYDALENVSIVYHCAAVVSFDPAHKKEMYRINAGGTANLVNASLERGVEGFCHVSSVAALGRNGVEKIVNENSWWTPSRMNSHYSISKFIAEREVWRASEEGLNTVIVNPSIILGAGNWHRGTGRLFGAASRGLKFYTNGSSGFVDARDVAEAMMQLTEKRLFNQRFILSSGTMTWKLLFNFLHREFGKPLPRFEAGRLLSGLAWRADSIRTKFSGLAPILTRETARSARSHFSYSNEKIIKELGFQFTPLEETLARCCKLYLESQRS